MKSITPDQKVKLDLIDTYSVAFKVAKEAALTASNPKEDGGTCNLDSVVIYLKGWRQADIDMLQKVSGVRFTTKIEGGFWKGYWFVDLPAHGQGNNRSRMVEAAAKKLKEFNVPVSVYYQMD